MTFPNGGQRDEGHPNRQVHRGRYLGGLGERPDGTGVFTHARIGQDDGSEVSVPFSHVPESVPWHNVVMDQEGFNNSWQMNSATPGKYNENPNSGLSSSRRAKT